MAILLNIWFPADSFPIGCQSYLTETSCYSCANQSDNFITPVPKKAFLNTVNAVPIHNKDTARLANFLQHILYTRQLRVLHIIKKKTALMQLTQKSMDCFKTIREHTVQVKYKREKSPTIKQKCVNMESKTLIAEDEFSFSVNCFHLRPAYDYTAPQENRTLPRAQTPNEM